MAKLRNPLLSMRASGSLGRVVTFLRRNRVNLVEKFPTHKDAKSPAQLYHRSMFNMCVDLWHTLSAAEKQIWERAGTARHMTGYSWYISQCLRPNPGIYLPLAGGTMTGVIDMDGQLVSGLPAPVGANDAVRKAYADGITGAYTAGAKVHREAVQTIPASNNTIVLFTHEDYDTDAIHDTGANTGRLTCRTAGKYLIIASYHWRGEATSYRIGSLYLNGTTTIHQTIKNSEDLDMRTFNLSFIQAMIIGDYVELQVYHEVVGGLDILWAADYTPFFMMQRIG